MAILLYASSGFLFLAGLSVFTKAHHPTTAHMGRTEHICACLSFIAGAIGAIVLESWWAIGIAIVIAWVFIAAGRRKRRARRPTLLASDYSHPLKYSNFVEWWLSNDPQVSEIRRPSTHALWSEGYRPDGVSRGEFASAEEFFRAALQANLQQLANASEQEWRAELDRTGEQVSPFLQTVTEIGEAYEVCFDPFDYRSLPSQVRVEIDLRRFKQAFLSERLLSVQWRLLMWLFHCRFGIWYTPQS